MKIVLTGGGTAGHVLPNLALVPSLVAAGFEISYIGGKTGMEKDLVSSFVVSGFNIEYYGISAGKLRRYLSFKNFSDMFRVVKGVSDARRVLKKIKPRVIFSKGGFVAVPVVLAARSLKIPVVIHESDITVGLANKLAIPHCKRVCYVFPETLAQLPAEKAVFAGTPIRAEIFNGSKLKGVQMCGFADNKPVLLVMGGSSGSAAINGILRDALPLLLPKFNIAHICGRGNVDKGLNGTGYRQFEYIGGGVSGGMGDLYALCELVVSRAGSNSLAEFLALNKPNILIPLPRSVSRGDQILNAQSFEKQGFSVVLQEEGLTADTLALAIGSAFDSRGAYRAAMAKSESGANGVEKIVELILEVSRL